MKALMIYCLLMATIVVVPFVSETETSKLAEVKSGVLLISTKANIHTTGSNQALESLQKTEVQN